MKKKKKQISSKKVSTSKKLQKKAKPQKKHCVRALGVSCIFTCQWEIQIFSVLEPTLFASHSFCFFFFLQTTTFLGEGETPRETIQGETSCFALNWLNLRTCSSAAGPSFSERPSWLPPSALSCLGWTLPESNAKDWSRAYNLHAPVSIWNLAFTRDNVWFSETYMI